MLKRTFPLPMRTALGLVLVAAWFIGATCVALAAQPATPVKPTATSTSAPHALRSTDAASASRDTRASYRRVTRIHYPAAAIAARTEAGIYVRTQISAEGRVIDAKVDTAVPSAAPDLANAALAAIKNWTFNPARAAGKPVPSEEVVPVIFMLYPDLRPKIDPLLEPMFHLRTLDAIRVSPPQHKR